MVAAGVMRGATVATAEPTPPYVFIARLTRRWWAPVQSHLAREGLNDRPLYFVSSNAHSLVNIATGVARDREKELVRFVESLPRGEILRDELAAFRDGRTEGAWENFLYFVARQWWDSRGPDGRSERRAAEQAAGVTHIASITALRVPAQVIPLAALARGRPDPRLGPVNIDALAASRAVVVNIDYPLVKAAYNIPYFEKSLSIAGQNYAGCTSWGRRRHSTPTWAT